MSKKQRIQEIQKEINFLAKETEGILLRSGVWTKLEKLAVKINIRRIEALEQELKEIDRE